MTDGDSAERRYWDEFVAERFPSYEAFWLAHVVPLTRRARDRREISFRSCEDLGTDADEAVTVAQLHYTTLIHLGRVHDLLHPQNRVWHPASELRALPGPGSAVLDTTALSATQGPEPSGSASFSEARYRASSSARDVDFDFDRFTEAFVRLAAASDTADEVLERQGTPGTYKPWNEGQGMSARSAWRRKHGDPLRRIRGYRNRLVHGRIVPRLLERGGSKYPRLDMVDEYLDWRRAGPESYVGVLQDFERGDVIVSDAWDQAVTYVETNWSTHLLV
jgi:hypothetical protein